MIAGKPVPDAGSDVRAAGPHAPDVPDEERPRRQHALLGVRGPDDGQVDGGRHPSGRAQGVRPGCDHKARRRASGNGVPGADYEPAGLAEAEGPLAVRVLGPNGAGPHDEGDGQRRVPRKVHNHTAHASMVHCDRAQQPELRCHNHVELGGPVNPVKGSGRQHRNRDVHGVIIIIDHYLIVNITVVE